MPPFSETAFRAFVVGHLAMLVAQEDSNGWRSQDLQYIIGKVKHAERVLPAPVHELGVETVKAIANWQAE